MDVLKKSCLGIFAIFILSGCQMGYYASSAYNQSKLLRARKPIEKVLQDPSVPEDTKRKLRLVLDVKEFGEKNLGLKANKSYLTYVALNRDHVSYVLQVAPFNELKHYEWSFPFVGKMPYKGYFNLDSAKEEAAKFAADKWDTYVRGVSAYSTLGWFHDPVLSSMLRASDHDLVDTIIHETVHANVYIKDAADFNERLATFLGGEGMKLYYLAKEGADSPTVKRVLTEEADAKLFSQFISRQLDDLKKWYDDHKVFTPSEKQARLDAIQKAFTTELQPKLKSDYYKNFPKLKLNNALLLTYKTYFYDLSDFEKLYELKGRNYQALLAFCQSLAREKKPEEALKAAITAKSTSSM